MKKARLPWNSRVPDFDVKLIWAPPLLPYSAAMPLDTTLISAIASMLMMLTCALVSASLAIMPSSMTVLRSSPPMLGTGAPLVAPSEAVLRSAWTPGIVRSRLSGSRPRATSDSIARSSSTAFFSALAVWTTALSA